MLHAGAGACVIGRNFLNAATPRPMNTINSTPCATANGGSFCVGASACRNEIFWNDCTTSTKQFKYNAMIAQTT